MRLRGWGRIQKIVQRAYLKSRPRGLVLLYHRICNLKSDPQLLSVSPENFSAHLEVIKRSFSPMSLQNLSNALQNKRVPDRSIALTFDDGYLDNVDIAQPYLAAAGIPATVYVVANYIDSDNELYWDELEHIFLKKEPLPQTIMIRANGRMETFEFASGETFANERERNWNVTMPVKTIRQRAYITLCAWLHDSDVKTRQSILNQIRDQTRHTPKQRDTHRLMSKSSLLQMKTHKVLDVGAHTLSHVSLACLSPRQQADEIGRAKAQLEQILKTPVTSFSYPYGQHVDFSRGTAKGVQKAGFDNAVTNIPNPVWAATDPFRIPRMLVRNWDGLEFERRLREWFWE